MKKLILMGTVLCSIMLSAATCSKEKEKAPEPKVESPYYFEFTLGGKAVKFASAEAQYYFIQPGMSGGYQTPSATELYPSINLYFQFNHAPTDAEIKALAGKKVVFSFDNADSVTAHLVYEESFGAEELYQDQSVNSDNYVQVDKVTFVKSASSIGIPIDVYEISGTCRSKMSEFSGSNVQQLENGKFNMLIARRTDQ